MPSKGYWRRTEVLAEHAQRRRKKYNSDPEFARAERLRARKAYRESKGEAWQNHARNALNVIRCAETDYSAAELSAMIGKGAYYINRLINHGIFPDPRLGRHRSIVFTAHQAYRLIEIFADHYDYISSTYTAAHKETKARFFAAI